MKKVLFVGLNPFATAGNSAMMYAILDQLDKTRYSASCFASDPRNFRSTGQDPLFRVMLRVRSPNG